MSERECIGCQRQGNELQIAMIRAFDHEGRRLQQNGKFYSLSALVPSWELS